MIDPREMKAALPARARLLGLDLGSKTIGLAISDSMLAVATPVATMRRVKFTKDAEALIALIEERGVGGLVLGLPKNMDGSEGPRAQSTRQFATNFLEKRDMPIALWDERLTTAEAERAMIAEADMSRKRRGEVIDKAAAAIILQNFLDFLRHAG